VCVCVELYDGTLEHACIEVASRMAAQFRTQVG
jgi:hypothetical protein